MRTFIVAVYSATRMNQQMVIASKCGGGCIVLRTVKSLIVNRKTRRSNQTKKQELRVLLRGNRKVIGFAQRSAITLGKGGFANAYATLENVQPHVRKCRVDGDF